MKILIFLAKMLGFENTMGKGTGNGYILEFEYREKK